MKRLLLPVVLSCVVPVLANAGVSWTSSPPSLTAANQSYTVGASQTAVSSAVQVAIYKDGAGVAGGGNGGPGNTSITGTASYTNSGGSAGQSVSWQAIGYKYSNGQMVTDGSVSKTTLVNSAPSASISGSTSLNVGQTGSWSFGATDSQANLSQWRFYASTNPNPQWSSASGSSVSGSYSTSFSSAGTYTWIVEANDSLGLTSSTSITVTVNGQSQSTVYISPNYPTITAGQSVAFTASGGSGSKNYTWGGSASGSGSTKSVTFNSTGTKTVTVYNPANGSYSASNTATATITVNAAPVDQPTVSVSPTSQSVNVGQSVTFAASGGAGSGSYIWGGTAGATGTGASKVVTFNSSGAKTVTVYRASSTGYTQSNIATATITVTADIAPPQILAQPQASAVSKGDTAQFTVTASGSGLAYQWRKDGVNIGGATGSTLEIASAVKDDVGSYDVFIYNNYGTVTSQAASLTVNEPPVVLAGSATVISPAEIRISASLKDFDANLQRMEAYIYEWSDVFASWNPCGSVNVSGSQATGVITLASYQASSSGLHYVWIRAYDTHGAADSTGGVLVVFDVGGLPATPSLVATPLYIAPGDPIRVNFESAPSSSWLGLFVWYTNDPTPVIPAIAIGGGGNGQVSFTNTSGLADNAEYFVKMYVGNTWQTESNLVYTQTHWGLTVIDGRGGVSSSAVGTVLPIQANPAPTGESFVGWTKIDPSMPGTIVNPESANNARFIMGSGYAAIRANYEGIPQISSPKTAYGEVDQPFTYTLTATNSPTSFTVSGLPSGLGYHFTYDPDLRVVIDGTPTVIGDFNIPVSAINEAGSDEGLLTLHIAGASTDVAPTITSQPTGLTAGIGYPFGLTVQATGSPSPTFQWRKNGVDIPGATASMLVRDPATESDAGVYTVVVRNRVGSVTSGSATVNVIPAVAPIITTQPQGASVSLGGSVTLTVAASGVPDVRYQWLRNNSAIIGATAPSLVLANLRPTEAGTYAVLVTNAVGGVISHPAVVAINYAQGDSDQNGIGDAWEQEYFETIGVDPTRLLANGLTILQAYNLRVNPNAAYNPNSTSPTMLVKLTAIGRGGSTGNDVALAINGTNYSFGFPSSAGNPWTSGWNSTVSIYVPFGALQTVQVTSTGDSTSDFFIRADVDPQTQPLLSSVVEFDGRLLGGIRKSEIQGNQFTLAVRPKDPVPFAVSDDSNLRLQRQLVLGLGRGRSGRSAGEILVSFGDWRSPAGAAVSVYKGEALEGSVETDPTHFQAKVPDGYVDVIRKHHQISIKFYDDSAPFGGGTYRDFAGLTPVAAYTLDISDAAVDPAPAPSHQYDNVWTQGRSSYCTLTRTAGDISHQLEYESYSFSSHDEAQSVDQDRGPAGGGWFSQQHWASHYVTVTHMWPWRKVGTPRQGLTRLEFDNPETRVILTQLSPFQLSETVTPGTSNFYGTSYLGAGETAVVGYLETYNTDGRDHRMVRAQPLSRGTGSDKQEMPRRQVEASGWSHPWITDLNDLGGITSTEPFGHRTVINGGGNFDGEPFVADGQPRQVRRSFLDNALNTATDVISTYSYVGNSDLIDGFPRPSEVVTKQGGVTIGRISYSYATGTLNGFTTLMTTETKADGGSDPLVTTTRSYSQRLANQPDLRGKPLAITRPDGTKVSYAYFASGGDLVVAELNGKDHNRGAPGTLIDSYSGASIDPLDMEVDKSTVTQRTFSRQGRLTREEIYLYHGSGYQLLSAVDFGYDALGHLELKSDLSGRVLYSANYTGFQKDDETDEQGVVLSYTYDNYNHVRTTTRAGASHDDHAVPAVVTTYGYDELGRPSTETVGNTDSVVTSYTYDTAGRPKTTRKFSTATAGSGSPGPLTTSIEYSSPYPTVTSTTYSDAGTRVETKFRDGRLASTTGTAVADVTFAYSYDSTSGCLRTTETGGSGQTKTTYHDWAGRTKEVHTATYSGATRVVANSYVGNLLRRQETRVNSVQIAPAHVFEYDDYGRMKRDGLTTGSGTTVTGGTDYEVKEYELGFAQNPSGVGTGWYRFDKVRVWPHDSGGAYVSNWRYASQTFTQVSGLDAVTAAHVVNLDFDGNKTETTATVDLAHANSVTETTSTGTSATIEQVTLGGLLVSSTNAQGQTTTQTYDALGRLQTSANPRTGTTYYAYHPRTTLVAAVTPPDNRIIGYGYDAAGRVNYQSTDSKKAYSQYDAAGNLTHQWGDTINPARYEYNDLGQRTKLHTYRSGTWTGNTLPSGFAGAGDVTTWTYQGATGLLLSKQDSANPATTYTYTDLGQIQSRTDSRGWVTIYEYTDPRKLLTKIDYTGDAALVTTDVTYHYDHAGRYDYLDDAAGRRTFSYYDTGATQGTLDTSARLKSETLTDLSNHTLTHRYQYGVAGRANGAPTGVDLNTSAFVTYGYDNVLRLETVTYNSGTPFTYAYVPNSNLIDTLTQGSGYQRDYDYRSDSDRLDKVKHFWSSSLTTESRLTYNTRGLRETEKTQGSAWMTALGRSSEAGVHADYTYTDRYEVDSTGKYVLGLDWSVGALRPDTARDYPYDAMGNRSSTASPVWTANSLNQVMAAPDLGTFSYDANGNMLCDGVRSYAYDAENRLITVTQGGSIWNYKYDHLGRRIEKSGTGVATTRFLYDGWNPVAELDGSNTVQRKFAWGLDAAGTLQSAGGVGGLLEIDATLVGGGTYRPLYDASHNVIGLYDDLGALSAAYEYDPFGNPQTATGSYGESNPFRSATKYTDWETGLVYYGLRYYSPQLGRFINRDPVEEQGGLNLYAFCGNDGINRYDYLGMEDVFDRIRRTGGTGPDGASGDTYARDNPFTTTIYGSNPDRSTGEYYASHDEHGRLSQYNYFVTDIPWKDKPEGTLSGIAAAGEVIRFWDSLAPNSRGIDPSGKGDIGTYLVRKNAAGDWVIVGMTNGVTTANAYVNGILGTLGRHAELGGKHMPAGVTEFTLFNNPSKGFFADVWETAMDKLGFTSAPAKALAGVLQGVQRSGSNVSWVAHSQGGAIFAEAMSYAGGSLSHNSVTFNAGANNHWVTNSIAASAGVQVNGYYYSSWDAVPNVIGANGNPLSMLGSVLAAPLLFTDNHSPHTAPTSGWRKRF